MAPPDSETWARSKLAVGRLVALREVPLREKTLWRMLYETCARAEEILGINVEELDLAGYRAPVKAKGAAVRCRGGRAREGFALETIYWDAGTARLLPRLLRSRTRGPVFVTRRRPGLGQAVSPRDVCSDTGLARLSTGRPARYWTCARPSEGRRAPAGTCESGGTPAWLT
jgi:integrase